MRAHGRQHRRHRGNKGQDDEPLLVSRDEACAESYSRSQQSTYNADNYRTHSSGKSSYEMNRESPSSRSHHDSDSWRRNDGYSYHDNYRRSGRDEYEAVEAREVEGWTSRRNDDAHYSQREEWPPRYEHASYSSSYQEQSSWNQPTSSSYSRWAEDSRGSHHDDHNDRNNDLAMQHQQHRRNSRDRWRQRDRRQDRGSQNHKADADMGWEPRYSGRGKGWDEGSGWDNSRVPSPSAERQWEPAASWKSSMRDDSENQRVHNQSGNRHTSSNKHSRSNRRHQNRSGHNRRDWKNDDGDLNNWSKRDNNVLERPEKHNKQFSSRRRHRRSFSRSRSHSPAGSYYSHYSSRGRSLSRSLSPSPKRRRREFSPTTRSPSPEDRDRGRGGWLTADKIQTISPVSHRNRDSWGSRRRSVSPVSSHVSDRSRSASPVDRPRAVHRLPSGPTPASEMLISQQRVKAPQEVPAQRTGKTGKKKGKSSRKAALAQSTSTEQMPPPSSVPSQTVPKLTSRRTASRNTPSPPAQTDSIVDTATEDATFTPLNSLPPRPTSTLASQTSRPPRPRPFVAGFDAKGGVSTPSQTSLSVKNAGFRPIGNGASSLKHFFPGDDDDRITPNAPLGQTQNQISEDRQVGQQSWDVDNHGSTHVIEKSTLLSRNHSLNAPQFVASSSANLSSPEHNHRSSFSDHDAHGRRSSETTPAPPTEVSGMDSHPVTTSSNDPPIELYTIVSQVGEGTFGKVYKARNTVTNVHVALKRIRMESEKDGFPVTAMREIKLLQSLRHINVVRLYEMMVSNGSVYMVFEYMDHDLTGILSQTQFQFSDAHLKSLCHQMLNGLAYLHHKGVVHRDIKGSNILINNRGELKLGDFGLARFYQKRRRTDYTNRVITLWYRPPELLFGATIYGPEVDMWSAGCIMLELFTKKPVFQGNDEISQLDVIYRIIGTPTQERWSGIANLPWYELIKPKDSIPNHFRDLFRKWMSPAALDLAEQLLDYDPTKRATAAQAMNTLYFTIEEPKAERPVGLSTLEGEWHELETKRERAKKRKKE